MDIAATVKNLLEVAGADRFGFARLERPLSIDLYREWIDRGHHGSMEFLAEHAELKSDPRKLSARARSAIVFARPYFPHPYIAASSPVPTLRTALYSKGDDYHHRFKAELNRYADALRAEYAEEEFLCFTDSAPILERDLAYRAGLGWVGKNTCLIDADTGSMFFIGQILTSLDLENQSEPQRDHCGTCDRCISACPTGAIEEPRKLNATKCISYWTIESRNNAPAEIRTKMGDWFFGCDICQTVCPWNEKAHGRDLLRSLNQENKPDTSDLRWVLSSSNKTLQKAFKRSPVSRARPTGLKRNALMMVGNLKITDLRPETERYIDDPVLGEIATWAIRQLT